MLTALILPHSNADIERVISQMNYVKSILINKMKLSVLNVILAITFGLIRVAKCSSTYTQPNTVCVRGAPWSTANRLHGQRTGAFSWRPVLGLSRKTDQFRLDPTQNCAPGWWCDRESSVYHLALEMYSGIFRHATNVPHAYQTPAPSLPPSNPP